MSGPYIGGLGQKRGRVRSGSQDSLPSSEESEAIFSSDFEDHPPKRSRRVSPTDAEIIPKFRPDETSSNITGWLHKIDQLGDVYGWTSTDRQFIMQLRLSGSARDWYDNLEEYDMTWMEWKKALKTAFPRSTDYVDRLEIMLARKKLDSESMTKYYHEKLSLLKKCSINGEKAISCIIHGLPAELRPNAKAYNCDTPEQLYYGYLSSLENFKRVELAMKSSWRRGNASASSTSMPAPQRLPKLCYACRRPGHEAKDCRSLLRCESCQRAGHTAANCWFAPGRNSLQTQQDPGAGGSAKNSTDGSRGTRPLQDGRVLATSSATHRNFR